ncbi:SRPBCC family protein [Streptomyces sp. NBC_01317]|uniref:SRPBCC family protein n=1 Tax=Streptomyces sp. NBC_01317 TaxID=2903822 RepID=UPI002E0D90DC|nr:SRPBCC family protein [Streptomyces sp. NBC_01317]
MNTTPWPDSLTTTDDGRSVLRMERRLPHPPERVWAAITEPASLGQWFPAEVSVEPRLGGAMTFRFPGPGPGAEGPRMTGEVTGFDAPRVFAYTWGSEHLSWTVTPDGDGSSLTLVHTFDDRAGAASFASGWQLCVTALGRLLDGEPGAVGRDTGELHESYVRQFDLERGVAEAVPGGRRVRFERQLVRPAETVWEILSAGIEPVAGLPVPEGFTAEKVPAGPVTEVRAPRSLTYTWQADGTVDWELTEGTGHGARLVLTQTGPEDFDTTAASAAWQTRIEELAARLVEA